MYKRVEHIDEEALDWGASLALLDDTEDIIVVEQRDTASILSWIKKMYSKMQRPKSSQNKIPDIADITPVRTPVKKTAWFKFTKRVEASAEESPLMVFVLVLFLLPLVSGVVISYALSFYYGGMSILSFYDTQKSDVLLGEWLIGFEITAWLGVIWLILLVINSKRSKSLA